MAGPNIFRAAGSALWALRVKRPSGAGSDSFDHGRLKPVLADLALPGGLDNVDSKSVALYVMSLGSVVPARLTRDEQLAFWLNAYNACAVALALDVAGAGFGSVLEMKSGFDRPVIEVDGENLSLTDIEHGKIRRFKDPRIHGSLVCGSLSCPTLRPEPFTGSQVQDQLEDQMTRFLRSGGAVADRESGTLSLSRVFFWYGSDFVRSARMPTLLPASRADIASAVVGWLDDGEQEWFRESDPAVMFQAYDWGLGCSVA